MPANKMPEMPEAVDSVAVFDDPREACQNSSVYPSAGEYYTADQMRAMYLAGIADARACVPDRRNGPHYDSGVADRAHEYNKAVDEALTNLTALEQEAKR